MSAPTACVPAMACCTCSSMVCIALLGLDGRGDAVSDARQAADGVGDARDRQHRLAGDLLHGTDLLGDLVGGRRVWWASALTSLATTAKPLPASPARADSIVAFSASRLVWSASC